MISPPADFIFEDTFLRARLCYFPCVFNFSQRINSFQIIYINPWLCVYIYIANFVKFCFTTNFASYDFQFLYHKHLDEDI